MNDFLMNLALELAVLCFFGALYYFYQKRKITQYENNKGPVIMGFILQACLSEKKDIPEAQLDTLIEALDDYLQNKTQNPPTALLKVFQDSGECSPELKNVIHEGLLEWEEHGKK